MHNPVDKMIIRTALHEQLYDVPDKMHFVSSPVGGSFGKVRSSGKKPHQGWDLYATLNAPVYAICDCMVVGTRSGLGAQQCEKNSYGNSVCVILADPSLQTLSQKLQCDLFAFYGHLADVTVEVGDKLSEGSVLGHVGRSGNACHSPTHLHFEIRTVAVPPRNSGLHHRIDPGEILGYENYSSTPDKALSL